MQERGAGHTTCTHPLLGLVPPTTHAAASPFSSMQLSYNYADLVGCDLLVARETRNDRVQYRPTQRSPRQQIMNGRLSRAW
jgi:hypothetical protein